MPRPRGRSPIVRCVSASIPRVMKLLELAALAVEDPQRGIARAGDLARRLEHLIEHGLGVQLRQQRAPDVDQAAQPLLVEVVAHLGVIRCQRTLSVPRCGEPACLLRSRADGGRRTRRRLARMNDAILLTAIAAGTALATGVGALPVIALGGERARAAQGVLSGFAAGVMAVAAIVGLLIPAASEGSARPSSRPRSPGALALVALRADARTPRARQRSQRGRHALAARHRRAVRPQPARGPGDRRGVRVRPGRASARSSSPRSRSRTCPRAPRRRRRCSPPATAPPSSSGARS